MKRHLSFLLLLAMLFCLFACQSTEEPKAPLARTYFEYFDTVSNVYCYSGDDESLFDDRCDAAKDTLSYYHRLFDIYNDYEGLNNLKTVNDSAGEAPVSVAPELIDFLIFAKEMFLLTNGEVNIAMGSVLRLWHDCREEANKNPSKAKIPTEEQLNEAANHTDIDMLIIDKDAGTVYLADPQMSLDVGALGKGYATDKAAESLIALGATSYVLNIGGNIRAIGTKPNGDGWLTGVTNPDKSSSESFVTKVTLKNISCVTSGDYERYYTVDGIRYHHIIDKDTLMPSDYFSSVTVLHSSSAVADALSTALFSMSYEEGKALADSLGAEVIWVTTGNYTVMRQPEAGF